MGFQFWCRLDKYFRFSRDLKDLESPESKSSGTFSRVSLHWWLRYLVLMRTAATVAYLGVPFDWRIIPIHLSDDDGSCHTPTYSKTLDCTTAAPIPRLWALCRFVAHSQPFVQ